jgi:hypothetical protein
MMQKRKIENRLWIVLNILLLVNTGCTKNVHRYFFNNMKESYTDLKIDSSSYFIKGFGMSRSPTKVKDELYWKINCTRSAFFYLAGYLKMEDDSIVLLPIDINSNSIVKEAKLFDFGAPVNSSWSLLLDSKGNMLYGDSVSYLGANKGNEDSVFRFVLRPYYFYKKNNSKSYFSYQFIVDVTKKDGLTNITAIDLTRGDTLFYASLYPKEKVINRLGHKLIL